ncbi:hypothetical protein ACI6PS_12405 [Flavobacterium sp. PLA-1-15]|uniref:hypothetical protein n=1 Tax=Flavobacterium sp. PLA-1-15 TaxID=3380533 RepID=UPI003B7EB36B
MIVILVLIIVALLCIVFLMVVKFRKMQEVHLQKLEDLHLIILELTKNQKINQEKIQLADEFRVKFNDSKIILTDKIVSLQLELLEIISKNNLTR